MILAGLRRGAPNLSMPAKTPLREWHQSSWPRPISEGDSKNEDLGRLGDVNSTNTMNYKNYKN